MSEDNRTGVLPNGWEVAPLVSLCRINPAPEYSQELLDEDPLVSFVPMRSVEAGSGRMDATTTRKLSEVRKGYTSFIEGDVLIAKITPCMENGKAAVARNLQGGLGSGSTEFHILRPRDLLDRQYLYYFVSRDGFRREARQHMTGTAGQLRVPARFVEDHDLPLPPLKEQKRIVEELEAILSDLDASIGFFHRIQAKLKRYRQAVLKAAVEGELSGEWREAHQGETEPASELLKRILAERRRRWEKSELAKMRAKGIEPKDEKWRERYQEPSESSAGLPELPKGWCWASMEQLLVSLGNGTSRVPHGSGGIRILRISSVRANRVDMNDVRSVPDSEALRGYRLQFGELLFTRYNGNPAFVGLCGMVPADGRVTVFPDKLIRGRVAMPETASYLAWSSNVGESRTFIEKRVRTTAGQAGVSGSDLKAMPVALPPIAEQEMLTAHVNRLLDGAAILGSQVSNNLRRAARLRQSILERAFRGELVPQDPNDEPTSVLLERIRAQRAAETDGKLRGKARFRKLRKAARSAIE